MQINCVKSNLQWSSRRFKWIRDRISCARVFLNAKYMLTISSMFKGSKRNVRNAINVTVCLKFHNYKQTLPKWQTYKESMVSKYAAVTLQARNTCAAVVITTYNPGQKSLGQYYNMHIFLSFLGSLLKQCIIFEIFLHFSLPHPIQSWN